MNSNHALQVGLRSLILGALTAFAAACGVAPEGQGSVDEQSPAEQADPDAAPPVVREAPALPSLPAMPASVPRDNGPGGTWGGGYAPPTQPAGIHTRS